MVRSRSSSSSTASSNENKDQAERKANREKTLGRSRMWETVDNSDDDQVDDEASKSKSKARKEKRKRSRSSSSDSASSGSESESSRSKKKHRHSSKASKKGKKKKKKGKHSSKHKKHRKKKRKSDKQVIGIDQNVYGSKGIIRQENFYDMQAEFDEWVRNEKKIFNFNGNKREAMELFAEFCEDFNTCTLPHEKYYDLSKYEHEKALKKQKKLRKQLQKNNGDDAAVDVQTRIAEEERQRLKSAHSALSAVDKAKAADMKEQELLKTKMKYYYDIGDIANARKIQEKLNASTGLTTYRDLHGI